MIQISMILHQSVCYQCSIIYVYDTTDQADIVNVFKLEMEIHLLKKKKLGIDVPNLHGKPNAAHSGPSTWLNTLNPTQPQGLD